jgi:hypothetical protein
MGRAFTFSRIGVVGTGVVVLGILGATLGIRSLRPPVLAREGPVFVRSGPNRHALSPKASAKLRGIFATRDEFALFGDHSYTSRFLEVDGRTYYWGGHSVKLDPEHGAHWAWTSAPELERMESASSGLTDWAQIARAVSAELERE